MNFEAIMYLNKVFNHSDIETTMRYIGYYESTDGNTGDGNNKLTEIEEAK